MLTFTGHKGSGFEFCDITTQTLTRGSQYQTSFLPEMASGAEYRVKVSATYKDYLPLEWDLNVKYLPNLDGFTKFIDLGTHIFYNTSTVRPTVPYQFTLSNVIDSQDDDLDIYNFELNDGMVTYYELTEQENVIQISDAKSAEIPIIGESIAYVSSEGTFSTSNRKFFNLKGQPSNIEIPLVSNLLDGELAVVLSWTQGSKVVGSNVEMQNLDLHVEYQASETVMCTIDFTNRQCNGVKMTADSFITDNRMSTVQAIKFDKIGDFDYMVYASRSLQTVENTDNAIKNMELEATLQIYSPRHSDPVYQVDLPFYSAENTEKYWIGFCLRGGRGINFDGVSVSDPIALFLNKPDVTQQCILDQDKIGTVGISPPTGVTATTLSPDMIELSWDEPAQNGGSPVQKYRIFVSEKDVSGSRLEINTNDAKTFYKLKTPKAMHGKDYVFTVQAINRN